MINSDYPDGGTASESPIVAVDSPPSVPVAPMVVRGETSVLTDDSTSIGVGSPMDRFGSTVPSADMFVSAGPGCVVGVSRVGYDGSCMGCSSL